MQKIARKRVEKRVVKRVRLALVDEIDVQLEALCEINHRSRGNMISVLIAREFQRMEKET